VRTSRSLIHDLHDLHEHWCMGTSRSPVHDLHEHWSVRTLHGYSLIFCVEFENGERFS
jgi:hypothetical protein